MDCISDQVDLRDLYGEIHTLAAHKVMPKLDRHCRRFIELSPFLVLATADAQGRADASPRGDAPGFVIVLDDTTLLMPDRPGNNRVDSYSNVVANPGVGLIFFVPGIEETLRVNGKARVTNDPALLQRGQAQGKTPKAGLVVAIEQAFFHCAKALKRAHLWDATRHVERRSFPSLGLIIAEETGMISAEEADARIAENYRAGMY